MVSAERTRFGYNNNKYSVVSSAYNLMDTSSMKKFMSLINKLKRRGPDSDLCGSPVFTNFQSERTPSTFTRLYDHTSRLSSMS